MQPGNGKMTRFNNSNNNLIIRGHSTTKWTKFYSILTPHPQQLQLFGQKISKATTITSRSKNNNCMICFATNLLTQFFHSYYFQSTGLANPQSFADHLLLEQQFQQFSHFDTIFHLGRSFCLS